MCSVKLEPKGWDQEQRPDLSNQQNVVYGEDFGRAIDNAIRTYEEFITCKAGRYRENDV